MSTICIHHKALDPFFSLAAEEYLLKNFEEDVFMIWRSEPSVVVGKHQNALAEINHRFVKENKIKVARRLSGGGTVFHDPGNVNFTFIKNADQINQVNFRMFTQPIINVLQKLGIKAYSTGRNDLVIDGKKVSGNAEHVFRKRVLHHGTLLFNSELSLLKNALKVDLSRFTDKSVQSNRSEVTNICNYLSKPMTSDEFSAFIFNEIKSWTGNYKEYSFSPADLVEINRLRDDKYSQWDWIYGYSPKYTYQHSLKTAEKKINFKLEVIKGNIDKASFNGDISLHLSYRLERALWGCRHEFEAINKELAPLNEELSVEEISIGELMGKMV